MLLDQILQTSLNKLISWVTSKRFLPLAQYFNTAFHSVFTDNFAVILYKFIYLFYVYNICKKNRDYLSIFSIAKLNKN